MVFRFWGFFPQYCLQNFLSVSAVSENQLNAWLCWGRAEGKCSVKMKCGFAAAWQVPLIALVLEELPNFCFIRTTAEERMS